MIYLRSLPLNTFAKSATCPSAEELLAFSKSLIPVADNQTVAAHLQECEFCGAELQLLKKYPYRPEPVPVAEMPPSLRLLAESILRNLAGIHAPCSLEPWRTLSH
jgi:hypothetical protein